ncbi:unnamed protein product [Agarophyton chilense]|eukprot:gb/GEZJ01001650.1/.p1 GENE.gb/GEZJ01001650.1/~~gb/GEZJ01001650.1/.p1  ORF type:complete len:508 (+),score=61.35 gb/GEZJ01001650.1/:1320-2843(+)
MAYQTSPPASPIPYAEERRHRYMVMLPSHDGTQTLVECLPHGSIRLPLIPTCPHFLATVRVRDVEKSIESILGVRVRFVRQLWTTNGEGNYVLWGETYTLIAVILVEWGEADKSIESGGTMKWMSRSEVRNANWMIAEEELGLDLKEVALKAIKQINGETHVWIPPWRCIGWFSKVLRWIKAVTKCDLGDQELYRRFEKCVDHHHSVVWACELDLSKTEVLWTVSVPKVERIYVKASQPLLQEAQRTATIARVLSELEVVPDIIAVDENDGVLIQRDAWSFEGLESDVDGQLLVNTIVRMQKTSLDHMEELQAGGLQVRDCEWLLANVSRLFGHKGLDKAVQGSKEYEDILLDLRCREEEVMEICKKISSFKVPNTLVHGDLTSANCGRRVSMGGNGYQFFDWSFSHIGHPFSDVDVCRDFFMESKTACDHWSLEYWRQWKSVVNKEQFWNLLDLVPLLVDCVPLDLFLTESEFQVEEWYGLSRRLREHLTFIQNDLDSVKQSTNPG